jgi:type II secretory pathway component PulJ
MSSARRHRAFTVMEVLVVSGAMSVLALIISSAWMAVGRPVGDMIARCRLTEEIDLATSSLTRDLGGCLANTAGRTGGKTDYRFVGWLQPGTSQLLLCFDAGTGDPEAPNITILYVVDNNRLVRWDQHANTSFTVAQNVDSLELTPIGDTIGIALSFSYRNLTRTRTFVARTP